MVEALTASESRQAAYDAAVTALHRVNPKALPVAKLEDVAAIPRVSEQARTAERPREVPPSPEHLLSARVSRMQDACASLAARAQRLGIDFKWPNKSEDIGVQLQRLNDFHDYLEKRVEYWQSTTQEQRAIDELRAKVGKIENQISSILIAFEALRSLLPHLMERAK